MYIQKEIDTVYMYLKLNSTMFIWSKELGWEMSEALWSSYMTVSVVDDTGVRSLATAKISDSLCLLKV